jgi:HSP20 family molecular chaperone IbpA
MSNTIAVQNNGVTGARPHVLRVATPPVDVYENKDEVLVVADVPGVPSGQVELHVENGTLTLQAKRAQDDVGSPVAREYEAFDFTRTFKIPAGIDTGNISAEAKNGTLLVRLPKIAAVKPRQIAVRQG